MSIKSIKTPIFKIWIWDTVESFPWTELEYNSVVTEIIQKSDGNYEIKTEFQNGINIDSYTICYIKPYKDEFILIEYS